MNLGGDTNILTTARTDREQKKLCALVMSEFREDVGRIKVQRLARGTL